MADITNDTAQQLRDIAAAPVGLVEFGRAGELLDVVGDRSYLHAGPPIRPSDTIGAMRGGLIAALMLEGEADTEEEAEAIVAAEDLEIRPCHEVRGAGSLAGIVSPQIPIAVVEREGGGRAFSTVVEGLGRAVSFGNHDETTLERVRWLGTEFCDVLNEAFALVPEMDLVDIQAKSLRRGDESHNRLVAATEKLIVNLAPAFVEIGDRSKPVLADLMANPHFFLTLSLATAKAVATAIEEEGPPGIATALAGNGLQAGIRVSGAPRPWYVAKAPEPSGLMVIPGTTEADAAPLIGDSGTTELIGLGAFSATASLALARVLGVDAAGAAAVVSDMRQITLAEHPRYLLPADDFQGSPFAVSVEAVDRLGITPCVHAGYAHRTPGLGRVGANLASFALEPFSLAAADLRGV